MCACGCVFVCMGECETVCVCVYVSVGGVRCVSVCVWKHFENFFVILGCQYRNLCLEIRDLSINACLWHDLLCCLVLIPK